MALWVEVTKRPAGNPTGANQHTEKDGENGGTVDIVNGSSPERPTGNSAAAGLRKTIKSN